MHHHRSSHLTRSRLAALLTILMVAVFALPSFAGAGPVTVPMTSEVWVADQGTNKVHVLSETGQQKAVIDLNGQVNRPHMLVFTPDFKYILAAGMGSGNVGVIRSADRQLVDVIATDLGAHAAIPSPDGRQVIVAHTTSQSLVELVWDAGAEKFVVGRRVNLASHPALADKSRFPNGSAICPAYTGDGGAIYVTLGGGGMIVVDSASLEIIKAYGKDQFGANGCGLVLSPDGTRMYANSGHAHHGEMYIFDTANHELLLTTHTGGHDAHGVIFTPDGRYLITLNRTSDNATFFDVQQQTITDTIYVGDAPDLPALSVNGHFLYVTLRGPHPATGTHDVAGSTPGLHIINLHSRTIMKHVDLGGGSHSDPHGIAVRPIPVNAR